MPMMKERLRKGGLTYEKTLCCDITLVFHALIRIPAEDTSRMPCKEQRAFVIELPTIKK